jgi:BON domain
MKYGTGIRLMQGMALAGLLGWGAVSVAQTAAAASKMPDAQVESNVLKALASASDLANQPITTTTVYGVVTLSGSVQTEEMRTEAENIASRTSGVQKVVDEMTLAGDHAAQQAPDAGAPQVNNGQLQSDGTMAPPSQDQAQGQPNPDNQQQQPAPNQSSGPNYGPGAPEYRQPYNGPHAPSPDVYAQQQGYPDQQGSPQQPNSSQQPSYPQQQPYPGYAQQRRGYAPPPRGGHAPQQTYGGQQEGQMVTIPGGAMIRVRINQSLDSGRTQPGARFDGVVVNDVVADGAVAIPRGATVHGTVLDAKKSGVLKGRGELSLQLTDVTLAGRTFPVASDVWAHHGGDKTAETVDKTAIGGGIGALLGAAAGGGEGAAIGAGIGGVLGLGSSAASGNGQVYVPSEGMLTFHITQPITVATVSQQEMDRLAQGVPPGAEGPQPLRRRAVYPAYGPVYYRAYPPYAPYPYSPYPYPY